MPTFRHGKSAVFKVDNSGGSLTDISDTLNSVSFPRDIETLETTSFGSSDRSYIVGFKNATISVEGSFDATVDEHLAGISDKMLLFHLNMAQKVQHLHLSSTQVSAL
jgi:hypothetical protein